MGFQVQMHTRVSITGHGWSETLWFYLFSLNYLLKWVFKGEIGKARWRRVGKIHPIREPPLENALDSYNFSDFILQTSMNALGTHVKMAVNVTISSMHMCASVSHATLDATATSVRIGFINSFNCVSSNLWLQSNQCDIEWVYRHSRR